jgi:hypothetical protein
LDRRQRKRKNDAIHHKGNAGECQCARASAVNDAPDEIQIEIEIGIEIESPRHLPLKHVALCDHDNGDFFAVVSGGLWIWGEGRRFR